VAPGRPASITWVMDTGWALSFFVGLVVAFGGLIFCVYRPSRAKRWRRDERIPLEDDPVEPRGRPPEAPDDR